MNRKSFFILKATVVDTDSKCLIDSGSKDMSLYDNISAALHFFYDVMYIVISVFVLVCL